MHNIYALFTSNLNAGFTGLTTRTSDLMIIKFKYMPIVTAGGDRNRIADRMHIVLHSDHTLNIHHTIVIFLDYVCI